MKLLALAACLAMAFIMPNAFADHEGCMTYGKSLEELLECMTLDGVRAHQAALQLIADTNGGTRATSEPGYEASVSYVVDQLTIAGYDVELSPFDYTYIPPVTLRQFTPISADYESAALTGTGIGAVTGPVTPVDLALGSGSWPADPATSTSGCEVTDFAGLDFSGPADIALIQRGFCFFSTKAVNAQAAGAEAVVFLNQGNSPDRMAVFGASASTLPDGTPSNLSIPVVAASFADGVALSQAGSTAIVEVQPDEARTAHSVIAELPGFLSGGVVMAGAHLDSVMEGPGIQDNGSGSAVLLEIAIQMASLSPPDTVRFAWWGGGEMDQLGSSAYASSLTGPEIEAIRLYLSVDEIASPNHVFFIQDLGASFSPVPEGTAEIQAFFETFYSAKGESFKSTPSSFTEPDWFAFFNLDIAIGGITTGATGIKTEEEAAIWGGVAGIQYDPCHHLACDTFDNVNLAALAVNSDAIAAALLRFSGFLEPTRVSVNVTKMFSDDSDDLVTVKLKCDGGDFSPTSATIEGGNPTGHTFVITNFQDGALNCSVAEIGGPSGYTSSPAKGCIFENMERSQVQYDCRFYNLAKDAEYTVTKDWTIVNEGGEAVKEDVWVTIKCNSPIDLEADNLNLVPPPPYEKSAWLGDGDSLMARVSTRAGDARCTAFEELDQSGVESENDCEGWTTLSAGDVYACTIFNTVFFEGIPTLNQYGLAIMALLMLGIGMGSYKRFA